MKRDWLKKILYWLFLLFAIYLIFELIRKIFGGSISFEGAVIALLVMNIGYSFHISSKLSEHIGWHKGMKNGKKR
ncbi:MAG: hypothetical protein KJ955_04900 [Nanoarchaeota archaeon]|nr:hypothetical protein [Nanoarchaeota archaeon]